MRTREGGRVILTRDEGKDGESTAEQIRTYCAAYVLHAAIFAEHRCGGMLHGAN